MKKTGNNPRKIRKGQAVGHGTLIVGLILLCWLTIIGRSIAENTVYSNKADIKIDSIISYLANDQNDLYANIEYDVKLDDSTLQELLNMILDEETAIIRNVEDGYFDFPKLEMEHTMISYRASVVPDFDGQEMLIVAFFPSGTPIMAACCFVSVEGTKVELFLDSTWMIIKKIESILGKPRYLWPIEEQYLVSRLFESEDAWLKYLLPSDQAASRESAITIANEALIKKGILSFSETGEYVIGAEYIKTEKYAKSPEGVWIVSYYIHKGEEYTLVFSVEIDGISKQVIEIRKAGRGLGKTNWLPRNYGSQG
ncbi:MAG: hypothetical protein IJG94_07655 [Clostridia bacterium]|nr:hypothetical protein [Clostridia bacterium]